VAIWNTNAKRALEVILETRFSLLFYCFKKSGLFQIYILFRWSETIDMGRFNDWLGNKLAILLSTMGCFYIIFALVIVPLFFSHPTDLVSWVQYIVQSLFQGVALPVLGFVAKRVGDRQEQVLNETHDAVIEELAIVKEELVLITEELKLAREERITLQKLVEELHQHHVSCSLS
jgi:hypothetical protein